MITSRKCLASLAFGLAVLAVASPSHARPLGRATAIHECSVQASRYVEYTWGDMDIQQYRACMAERGEQE
jgi:hypothetical protein